MCQTAERASHVIKWGSTRRATRRFVTFCRVVRPAMPTQIATLPQQTVVTLLRRTNESFTAILPLWLCAGTQRLVHDVSSTASSITTSKLDKQRLPSGDHYAISKTVPIRISWGTGGPTVFYRVHTSAKPLRNLKFSKTNLKRCLRSLDQQRVCCGRECQCQSPKCALARNLGVTHGRQCNTRADGYNAHRQPGGQHDLPK